MMDRRVMLMMLGGNEMNYVTGTITPEEDVNYLKVNIGVDNSRIKVIVCYAEIEALSDLPENNSMLDIQQIIEPWLSMNDYAGVTPYYVLMLYRNSAGNIVSGSASRSQQSSGPSNATGEDTYWIFRGNSSSVMFKANTTYRWKAYLV